MPGLERLKIMIVSANAHEYNPGGGENLHDDFIMKPVDIQLLLERLGALLKLAWIYESTGATSILTTVAKHNAALLPDPARHHLDDLYRLGSIGHVRGIEAKLREIEAEDAANQELATHLRKLVGSFDLKGYMSVLEGMRKNA